MLNHSEYYVHILQFGRVHGFGSANSLSTSYFSHVQQCSTSYFGMTLIGNYCIKPPNVLKTVHLIEVVNSVEFYIPPSFIFDYVHISPLIRALPPLIEYHPFVHLPHYIIEFYCTVGLRVSQFQSMQDGAISH